MSILKSANSGRYEIVKSFFDNYCKNRDGMSYEIICTDSDYKVKLTPAYLGQILNINLKEFPCKVLFDNSPYPIFKSFNVKEQLNKITKDFHSFCYKYKFSDCVFDEEIFKFVLNNYNHLERCIIKFPDNFIEIIESKKVPLISFLKKLKDNNNILLYNEKNSNPKIFNLSGITDLDNYFSFDLTDIEKIKKIFETYSNF